MLASQICGSCLWLVKTPWSPLWSSWWTVVLDAVLLAFSSITNYPGSPAFTDLKAGPLGSIRQETWKPAGSWEGWGSALYKGYVQCWNISYCCCQRNSSTPQRVFSSVQPCVVHRAPKVSTNINKPLENGEMKTSYWGEQDLDFFGTKLYIYLPLVQYGQNPLLESNLWHEEKCSFPLS